MKRLTILLTLLLSSVCFGVGERILDGADPYYITTPYDGNDLFDIQYVQSADTMYLSHVEYAPRVLIRTGETNWVLSQLDFQRGPFLAGNTNTSLTITPSGTGVYSGTDFYRTGDNGAKICYAVTWLAQTFTAGDNYSTDGAQVKLYRIGNPGTVTVSLRATAAGLPTGADLVSGTLDGNLLTTEVGGEWYQVSWTSQALTLGTVYAIVVRAPSGTVILYGPGLIYPVNTLHWRIDSTAPTYAGGSYIQSVNSGSSWTAYTTGDFMFGIANASVPATNITLSSNGPIWDANHVGALWQLTHTVASTSADGSFAGTGYSSTVSIQQGRSFDFSTSGNWSGTVILQRSYDGGTTYQDIKTFTSNNDGNTTYGSSEVIDDALYRIRMYAYTSGTCYYILMARAFELNGVVKITGFTDVNNVSAEVKYELGATDATSRWAEGAWSVDEGYPACVAFFEERLVFAGTRNSPQTIWFSQTNDWDNFLEGSNDSDAMTVTLATDQVNAVRWMRPQERLIIGTSDSEWTLGGSNPDEALTPTNIQATRHSTNGSKLLQAIAVDNKIFYVQRQGLKVRNIHYTFDEDTWVSPDLTLLSEHVTESGIVDWAYQRNPYPVLWCVLTDGDIAALTFEDTQQIVGWHRHTHDGDFKSVAVIPGESEDRVWFVTANTIDSNSVKYVEQLQPFDWGTDQRDVFFVDSGITWDGGASKTVTAITKANPAVVSCTAHGFTEGEQVRFFDVVGMTQVNNKVFTVGAGPGANDFHLHDYANIGDINSVAFTTFTSGSVEQVENTISTLSHLEGETVTICGDGGYYGTEVVDANTITLDDHFNTLHIGLPFTAKLQPMKLSNQINPVEFFSTNKRITEVVLRLYETLGCDVGTSWSVYDSMIFRDADDELEAPPPLFTGDKELDFEGDYETEGNIYIQNRFPLPITVLAIKVDVENYP